MMQEEDFVARDDFDDADQLRIGNDGIFMLTFFSKKQTFVTVTINRLDANVQLCWPIKDKIYSPLI